MLIVVHIDHTLHTQTMPQALCASEKTDMEIKKAASGRNSSLLRMHGLLKLSSPTVLQVGAHLCLPSRSVLTNFPIGQTERQVARGAAVSG